MNAAFSGLFHVFRFTALRAVRFSGTPSLKTVLATLASVLVFGGFAAGAYAGAHVATVYLLGVERLGLFLFHRYLSMLLFVFFLSISVGNIIVSYATFYRSPEMTFYLTKPVSHTSLFVMKFLDNFFYSSTAFFLMALAVFLGYGSYFHFGWLFYVRTMLFVLIPFMLLAAAVAVTLLLAFMRYADSIGLPKIIASLVLLYLSALYGYFSVTNPVRLQARVLQFYPNLDQYFGFLDPPLAKAMPNHWVSEVLYWSARGDSQAALSYELLLIGAAALVLVLMVLVARRVFYAGWLSSLHIRLAAIHDSAAGPGVLDFGRGSPGVDSQSDVLVKKEILQFVREPSQWIHFGVITILIVTFVGSMAQVNLSQPDPFLQTVSYSVVLLFNAFLIASIALRFVFPSVSIEGVNLWPVWSAPVSRRKVFWLKFAFGIIPVLLASAVLVVFSHRTLRQFPLLVPVALLIMGCVAFALVALNLGAGSLSTDYREKNPIRVASSQTATLTFLVSLAYLAIVLLLTFMPYRTYFGNVFRGAPVESGGMWLSVGVVAVLSLGFGTAMLAAGMKALQRDY